MQETLFTMIFEEFKPYLIGIITILCIILLFVFLMYLDNGRKLQILKQIEKNTYKDENE